MRTLLKYLKMFVVTLLGAALGLVAIILLMVALVQVMLWIQAGLR